jgi:hypothetical protein
MLQVAAHLDIADPGHASCALFRILTPKRLLLDAPTSKREKEREREREGGGERDGRPSLCRVLPDFLDMLAQFLTMEPMLRE